MFNLCNHKWGEVNGSYQYCIKCNIARSVECFHIWNVIQKIDRIKSGDVMSKIFVLQCSVCGDIKKTEID